MGMDYALTFLGLATTPHGPNLRELHNRYSDSHLLSRNRWHCHARVPHWSRRAVRRSLSRWRAPMRCHTAAFLATDGIWTVAERGLCNILRPAYHSVGCVGVHARDFRALLCVAFRAAVDRLPRKR